MQPGYGYGYHKDDHDDKKKKIDNLSRILLGAVFVCVILTFVAESMWPGSTGKTIGDVTFVGATVAAVGWIILYYVRHIEDIKKL